MLKLQIVIIDFIVLLCYLLNLFIVLHTVGNRIKSDHLYSVIFLSDYGIFIGQSLFFRLDHGSSPCPEVIGLLFYLKQSTSMLLCKMPQQDE